MSIQLAPSDELGSTAVQECVPNPATPKGRLVPLRTKAEVDASFTTVDAYVTEIPQKSANRALTIIDEALRQRDGVNLQHLRRFIRPAYIPHRLGRLVKGNPLNGTVHGPSIEQGADTLYFLVCATSVLTLEEVTALLAPSIQPLLPLQRVTVPLLPPSCAEQASRWSQEYWPTVYKNTNPFGPHPSIVARAQGEISHEVRRYMDLARAAGKAVAGASKGRNIGAVVVDRSETPNASVIAVAGDARWDMASMVTKSDTGNVLGHAVMRVIGFVARKRQELLEKPSEASTKDSNSTAFADEPLTELERHAYRSVSIKSSGYLCVDLEIYLTHEPCVMCSMAILHSRFGRVVFAQRMPKTGGLSAEIDRSDEVRHELETSYGLFWRPELNWKLLAWQWLPDEPLQVALDDLDLHA